MTFLTSYLYDMGDVSGTDNVLLALDEPASTVSYNILKFLKSQKGGDIVVHEGFDYLRNRHLTNGRSYWNCRKKDKHGCKAKLILDASNVVLSFTEHNHATNISEVGADEALAKFRERARESFTNPRQLHSELVQDMSKEVASHLPTAYNMARVVRWQRKVQLPTPTRREDIDLEAYLAKSELGKESVLYDSGRMDSKRIIILKAEDFRYLRDADTWIMDGTFRMVPSLFMQLYTIHVDFFGGVFPVLFALLPDKTTETYERLFREVRTALESMPFKSSGDLGGRLKPNYIVIDFEMAVIKTVEKIFPHTRIQGK